MCSAGQCHLRLQAPTAPQMRAGSSGEASTSRDASTQARVTSQSWANLLLELPLELAAVGGRTNERWLRKRKRSRWWSRKFPKACPEL